MPSRSLTTVMNAVEARIPTRGLFPGEALDRAKAALVKLLDATVIVRSPERTPEGGIKYVEVPDNAIILAASVKLIEFETGKAPQTIDINTPAPGGSAPNPQDMLKMLAKNPALAEKIMASIVGAARNVASIEVQATSSDSKDSGPESQSEGSPS